MPQVPGRAIIIRFLDRMDARELALGWLRWLRHTRIRMTSTTARLRRLPSVRRRLGDDDRYEALVSYGAAVAARPLGLTTAATARSRNLQHVTDLLDRHSIPYMCLPAQPRARPRIAVSVDDRDALVNVLTAEAPRGAFALIFTSGSVPPIGPRMVRSSGLDRSRTKSKLAKGTMWCVFEFYAADGHVALGDEVGCEIEFWVPAPDSVPDLQPQHWNRTVDCVPPALLGSEPSGHPLVAQVEQFADAPYISDVHFPVDVVYTWVDGSDPDWLRSRERTFANLDLAGRNEEAANRSRYESRDELKYSLRSLELFADFVNHVYLVTADQRPEWLVEDHPRLTVVSHQDIFDRQEDLPTFNSHSIEARLHHVEGLSEHYVYMNDDFFFGRPMSAETFFEGNGWARFFYSPALMPLGRPTPATKPVDAAAMNGRDLIERHFGVRVSRKFKHAPYPQLRSVHLDIEKWFPEEVARTVSSKVRSPGDLALASSLHHYVAYASHRALSGGIRSAYVNLDEPDLQARLFELTRVRGWDVLCLNDTTTADDARFVEQDRLVRAFLDECFPNKSSFER